ncbi:conjugal transfer protein TraF [Pseudomonas sp. zjy_13]|uniref:conjugal transfer protein TraF n=1 Tax=Pseudomonas sp. zjy_13 TaxID=3367263 RepID=UPI003709E74D
MGLSSRKWLLTAALPLAALAATSESPQNAAPHFYSGKGEGWFWYQEPPVEIEEEPVPPVVVESAAAQPAEPVKTSGPPVFSVAWLREKLPAARERAIDHPTPENMEAYYYLQRISLDKAQRFADVSRFITISDPLIDESIRRSTSSFAANEQTRAAGVSQQQVLTKISQKAGLFFFFKANCDLCIRQAQVLKSFKSQSEFTIIPVSLDGSFLEGNPFGLYQRDNGQAKRLGISDAPALALAIPPKTAKVVSFAPIAADALKGRIVLVAKNINLISDEDYKKTLPYNDTGYLLGDALEGMPSDLYDDPKKFTAFIRQHAKSSGTYRGQELTPPSSPQDQGEKPKVRDLEAETLNFLLSTPPETPK